MMELFLIIFTTWLAGVMAFVGGYIAKNENYPETQEKKELIHALIAFGGGILISAVAFALAPEAIRRLDPVGLILSFAFGGICFAALDVHMLRENKPNAQFIAMLLDFLPEAVSLGAVFVSNSRLGVLLAAYIGAQNLPEGFNSYRELRASGYSPQTVLRVLFAMSIFGPLAGLFGYLFLHDNPLLTAGLMNFAAGGILYLVFQDIAPLSKRRRHWGPPLGAVFGFIIGMLGKKLIGA